METDKVIQLEKEKLRPDELVFSADEKLRLVDFFSILIEIDQRNKRKNNEVKTV